MVINITKDVNDIIKLFKKRSLLSIKDGLVDVLDSLEYYTEKDICNICGYVNSYRCNKKFVEGIKENYLIPYKIKIYVYKHNTNNKITISNNIHTKEMNHHRLGAYFALQSTNFHCGEATECACDKDKCINHQKLKNRIQPHCIRLFGIKMDKYRDFNYGFILSNLDEYDIEIPS